MVFEQEQMLMLTENRLLQEGNSLGFLLEKAKRWTPATLVEEKEWKRIIACAQNLPISMGAFPFGFEFLLHTVSATADLGVTLAAGSSTYNEFNERATNSANTEKLAGSIVNIFKKMDGDGEISSLRDIVGNRLTLEFDVGSANKVISELPGFFLRSNQYSPIDKSNDDKINDVFMVVNALFSSVGHKLNLAEKRKLAQICLAQPNSTSIDSFGIFPSRHMSCGIRLTILGFTSPKELNSFLKTIEWPDDTSIVDRVVKSFLDDTDIASYGVNLDIQGESIGPTLGVTALAKNRFTNDPRNWIDNTNSWSKFLDALSEEEIVIKEKLSALRRGWISKPKYLYGKTGRFVLLRGIHHIKLVIHDGSLNQVKAYVYMLLSTLDHPQ